MEESRYKIYRPDNEAVAVVQILHGMQEYKERYEYFIKKLNENNIACIIHDQLGHGKNCPESDLGFFKASNGWKQLIYDTCEVQEIMKKEYPNLPYVLFGHSMGAIVARSYLKRHDKDISALILSGAPNYTSAAAMGKNLSAMVVKFKGAKAHSKFLTNLFMGPFNKGYDSLNMWLSRNQENVDKYNNDPNCGFPFTAKGFEDIASGIMDIHEIKNWHLGNDELPILFVAGENDPCIGGEKGFNDSIDTLKTVGYKNVEFHQFFNLRHEILNEKEKDDVIDYILEWLKNKRII